MSLPTVVTTEWLAAHLGEPDLRVIDATWYLPTLKRDARAEYVTAHVPGAVYFDIDAIKVVARGVQEVRTDRSELGVLLITHYQRILSYLQPDKVHVLIDGRIVESGGPELAERLEAEGYEAISR